MLLRVERYLHRQCRGRKYFDEVVDATTRQLLAAGLQRQLYAPKKRKKKKKKKKKEGEPADHTTMQAQQKEQMDLQKKLLQV